MASSLSERSHFLRRVNLEKRGASGRRGCCLARRRAGHARVCADAAAWARRHAECPGCTGWCWMHGTPIQQGTPTAGAFPTTGVSSVGVGCAKSGPRTAAGPGAHKAKTGRVGCEEVAREGWRSNGHAGRAPTKRGQQLLAGPGRRRVDLHVVHARGGECRRRGGRADACLVARAPACERTACVEIGTRGSVKVAPCWPSPAAFPRVRSGGGRALRDEGLSGAVRFGRDP